MTTGPRAEIAFWLALSIIVAGLFGVPLFLMTYFNADYLQIANEALAATYFTCERLAHGEGGSAWLPHGHILGLFQRVILSIVHQVVDGGADMLQQRLNLFASLTALANVLFMSAIVVMVGTSRTLRRSDKVLVFWSGLVPLYATGGLGFWYAVQPAYYQLDMAFVPLAVGVFLWQLRAPPSSRPTAQAALLGTLAGLMMSNKITMGLLGVMVVAPVLSVPPVTVRRAFGRALVAGIASMVTMLGALWVFYGFRLHALFKMLVRYSVFTACPGGEDAFWTQIIWSMCRECYLHWIILCWVLSALTALVAGVYGMERPWFGRTVTFMNLSCGVGCGLALVKHPSGTMLFEVVVMLAGLSAMAIGAINLPRIRRGVTLVAILGAIAPAALTHPWTGWAAQAEATRAQAAEMWGMQRDILRIAAGRRIVVLLPDNSYVFGGVPELLLKGAAVCTTWEIHHGGQRLLRELAPGMEFRVGHAIAAAAPFPENSVVVWFDPCGRPPLTERYPSLQKLYHQPGMGARAHYWAGRSHGPGLAWLVTGLVQVRVTVSPSPQQP